MHYIAQGVGAFLVADKAEIPPWYRASIRRMFMAYPRPGLAHLVILNRHRIVKILS